MKHKIDAGSTITFSFEFVVSCEKNAIYDEAEFRSFMKDCAIRYIRDLVKHERDYDFDD